MFFFVPFDFTHVNKQNELEISMIAYKNLSVVYYSQEFALSLPTFSSKFYSISRMKQKTYTDTPSSSSIFYCNNRLGILWRMKDETFHPTLHFLAIQWNFNCSNSTSKRNRFLSTLTCLSSTNSIGILEIMQSKELK